MLGGKRIEVIPASHTVPAVGFAVDGGTAGWWVYTGDTGPNPALWQRLQSMNVAHLVIETAFGDDERQLARISRHLCPSALVHELKAGKHDLVVVGTHGRTGLSHVLLGSVAEKLARLSPVPVVTVPDVVAQNLRA